MKTPGLIELALKLSRADDCIVVAEDLSSANLRWANNAITTSGQTSSREFFVISIIDHKVGIFGQNYVTEDNIESLVRESEAACQHQLPAEDYMDLLQGNQAGADTWHTVSATTSIDAFSNLLNQLTKNFTDAKLGERRIFGYAEHHITTIYLANSQGMRLRFEQPGGKFEISAKSKDYADSAWSGRAVTDFSTLDISSHTGQINQRLEWSRQKISLPAGQYETLLSPSCMADLTLYAYAFAAASRDADEGRTVFSKPGGGNKIGEQLFSPEVALYSDPDEPGLETAPFNVAVASSSESSVFDNGWPLKKTYWAKDGRLNNLITTRHWAKFGPGKIQPTPFIPNLVFESPTGPSLEEMIASTKKGLLVTCLWYIREVDSPSLLLTGLTRDGVFLIEDGEVKGAVNNFRWNMSPINALAQISEVGLSEATLAREWGDYFTLTKFPPVRVKDFNMSSVSQAN